MLCSINENPFKITNIEKYQIIDSLKKVYTIEKLASLLNITSRAYRKWISKGKPIANNFNEDLAELILVEHLNNFEVYGTLSSMSRPGACWENSPIENWFSQLKEEQLRRIGKQSKSETRKSIKKYVQWYNTERIQKDLNYQSPIQFLNSN